MLHHLFSPSRTMFGRAARGLPKRHARKMLLTYSPQMSIRLASSTMPKVDPPLSTALPADTYQLLPTLEKAGSSEDALFEQQVNEVKEWWSSSRYEEIKRPYSAEDVVSKRGTLQQTYPSSLMARKLFNLLKEKTAAGEPVHTSWSSWFNRSMRWRTETR